MLWRDLSRLTRAAVVATALAVALAVLMVIVLAVSKGDPGVAAFYLWMYAATAALILWGIVAARRLWSVIHTVR